MCLIWFRPPDAGRRLSVVAPGFGSWLPSRDGLPRRAREGVGESTRNKAGRARMPLFRVVAKVSHRDVSHLVVLRPGRDASCPASNRPARRSGVYRVGDGLNEANAEISGLVALCEEPVAALKSHHSLRLGVADKQGNAKSRGGQG